MTPASTSRLLLIFLLGIPALSFPAPGTRILEYLHARSEGLDRIWPQPITAIYISANWTDAGPTPDYVVIDAVDQGFNVVILT